MIGRLFDLLAGTPEPGPENHQDRVAVAVSALLLEMAHADGEFDEQEERHLEALITQRFHLAGEARDELLALAQQKRHASVDLYAFTRLLNEHFSAEEKFDLVRELWRLVFSDGVMHHHEEYLVRRVADLLRLPHRKMIEAKLLVRQELGS